MQSSSAWPATSGKSSEIHWPLWPCWLNFHGEPSSLAPFSLATGEGLPVSAVRRGLKSNVSTCDGAPCMHRKITRLALAGKWGGRAAKRRPLAVAIGGRGQRREPGEGDIAEARGKALQEGPARKKIGIFGHDDVILVRSLWVVIDHQSRYRNSALA